MVAGDPQPATPQLETATAAFRTLGRRCIPDTSPSGLSWNSSASDSPCTAPAVMHGNDMADLHVILATTAHEARPLVAHKDALALAR